MKARQMPPPVRAVWHRAALCLAVPYPLLAVLLLSHGGTVPVTISALTLGCSLTIPFLMRHHSIELDARPCPTLLLVAMILVVAARLVNDAILTGPSLLLPAFAITTAAMVAAAFEERRHQGRVRRHRRTRVPRSPGAERAARWLEAELTEQGDRLQGRVIQPV